MEREWFCHLDAETVGPISTEEVKQLVRKNRLNVVQVWTEGMEEWADARTIQQFAQLFPPLLNPKAPRPVSSNVQNTEAVSPEAVTNISGAPETRNLVSRQFSRIDSPTHARKMAREGAIAGLLVVGMEAIGLLFQLLSGKNASTGEVTISGDEQFVYIGSAVLFPALLFLVWRVYSGKGYLSAAILTLVFSYEVATKVVFGTTNVGWGVFYAVVFLALVNGIRACWYLKRKKAQVA